MNDALKIPALSIKQPWAELIMRGEKKIEIREWETGYRGKIYLHTGKKPDGYKLLDYGMKDIFRGGYLGTVEIKAIMPFSLETWSKWRKFHLDTGRFHEGLYAWILENPLRFPSPIPGPGQLGLFYPEEEVLLKIQKH